MKRKRQGPTIIEDAQRPARVVSARSLVEEHPTRCNCVFLSPLCVLSREIPIASVRNMIFAALSPVDIHMLAYSHYGGTLTPIAEEHAVVILQLDDDAKRFSYIYTYELRENWYRKHHCESLPHWIVRTSIFNGRFQLLVYLKSVGDYQLCVGDMFDMARRRNRDAFEWMLGVLRAQQESRVLMLELIRYLVRDWNTTLDWAVKNTSLCFAALPLELETQP